MKLEKTLDTEDAGQNIPTLSAMAYMAEGGGPIKAIPSLARASAKKKGIA